MTVKTKNKSKCVDEGEVLTYTSTDFGGERVLMDKLDVRKSQSFTIGEVTVGLEILKFAMRSNDMKVLAHRSDFISLYRKFARMKEKMEEALAEKMAKLEASD